ncbi:hypothetical protein NM688_g1941 [Phlebia brevispora]|uniref:Uncharacterized protein n=1 Tax=Phlebia brevispora TaxID=194682 RepID=A0ACC1T9X2_9APHY|nr:hypothetical protein NM688_g1941 [Phlebia brevispora]
MAGIAVAANVFQIVGGVDLALRASSELASTAYETHKKDSIGAHLRRGVAHLQQVTTELETYGDKIPDYETKKFRERHKHLRRRGLTIEADAHKATGFKRFFSPAGRKVKSDARNWERDTEDLNFKTKRTSMHYCSEWEAKEEERAEQEHASQPTDDSQCPFTDDAALPGTEIARNSTDGTAMDYTVGGFAAAMNGEIVPSVPPGLRLVDKPDNKVQFPIPGGSNYIEMQVMPSAHVPDSL